MLVWTALFVVGIQFVGVPTSDPLIAFGWLWLATIAWRNDEPWRTHLRFPRDWLPICLLLAVYNMSRAWADGLAEPHVTELIAFDRWAFGWFTGGLTPTEWLQQHLWQPNVVQWWEVVVSIVYFSHFLTLPTIAVVLWMRSRPRWARFMRRWFLLSVFGLITYFAYPAAPPWWADQYRGLVEATRISTNGWKAIGLEGAGNTLNALQVETANDVAAMPSLHTAFAFMAVVFFLPAVRRRWWPLLLMYPLSMTFTLVYTAEHWVIDVLVGWAYVGFVFLIGGIGERWWTRQHPDPVR
ncbi:phosphatase PAP2 family protein [Actinoplanes sp. DH11]|uniref:phosphatase PAP2 family protein n=1 Tax=Actinoplanes sp. DH11 TaxID=2857011 RepID=UPI001E4D6D72|nr:phosphatase PAP2 family protein [Actinoplanes sp. DH11]